MQYSFGSKLIKAEWISICCCSAVMTWQDIAIYLQNPSVHEKSKVPVSVAYIAVMGYFE